MVRMTLWMSMLWMACTSAGCGYFMDYVDTTCFELKCEHRAKAAWMEARDLYHGVAHRYNFGEGFRDGYMSVCMGDDTGCAPAVPPRRYWSSAYLNCEGKAKTMAWFDGYAHGVLAASCSGTAGQCQIATIAGGGGANELGTALKGYKPPMPNTSAREFHPEPYQSRGYDYYDPTPYGPTPYGPTPYGPTPYGPTPYGPGAYDRQPTPMQSPIVPPAAQPPVPTEDVVPQFNGEFAPEAPAEPTLPHEAGPSSGTGPLPAAEAFRVPTF